MRRFLFLLLLSVVGVCVAAQETLTCRISIPANVVNEKTNQPVSGLSRQTFELRIGKSSIGPDQVGYVIAGRVFVFFDASGSMLQPGQQSSLLLGVARELVSGIPEQTQLVPYVFAISSQRFDRRDLERFLTDQLSQPPATRKLGSRTNLYGNLLDAVHRENMNARDVVVVVSDGGDSAAKAKPEEVEREFERRGVRILTLLFANAEHRSQEEETGAERAKEMATHTGGMSFWSPESVNKKAALLPREFFMNVLGYYLLRFDNASFAGERIHISAIDAGGKKLHSTVVHAAERAPVCN